MPTLTIGTRTYRASNAGVVGEADQMFKLSPERRVHRLAHAKPALARASGAKGSTEDLPATKAAVAIILSQGRPRSDRGRAGADSQSAAEPRGPVFKRQSCASSL
jgi:hypothetical protein